MDAELFEIVGFEHKRFQWTDEQLGEHIAVLECVSRYFKGREDAIMIWKAMRAEYETLLGFKYERERKEFPHEDINKEKDWTY
jgi:hypothetical protein